MPMPENKITVYNTLTRSNELMTFPNGKINMFVCGQTVYDDAHLGHAKAYINYDIIVRWLRYSGYTVNYIQSITDYYVVIYVRLCVPKMGIVVYSLIAYKQVYLPIREWRNWESQRMYCIWLFCFQASISTTARNVCVYQYARRLYRR